MIGRLRDHGIDPWIDERPNVSAAAAAT